MSNLSVPSDTDQKDKCGYTSDASSAVLAVCEELASEAMEALEGVLAKSAGECAFLAPLCVLCLKRCVLRTAAVLSLGIIIISRARELALQHAFFFIFTGAQH